MKKALLILTVISGLAAAATTTKLTALQVNNAGEGWVFHALEPGSFEASFSGNASGILNFDEGPNGPLATVAIHHAPAPANLKLGDDATAWHKFFFSGPQKFRHSYLSERTFRVSGQWRYIVEFTSETGTMLNTIIMAEIVDGQIYVLSFDQHRPEYIKLVASIRVLFHNITLSATTAPTAAEKSAPTADKSDKS